MGAFRQIGEAELAKLSDEELIAYVLDSREAGESDAAELALRIFAFGMQDRLLNFVRSQLDSHGNSVIEEVAEVALADSIRSISRLRGASAGEARAFVFKITRLRVIDYLRSNRVRPISLDVGWDDDEKPEVDVDDPSAEGEVEAVGTTLLVNECLDGLRADHRAVVEYTIFDDLPASETTEKGNSRFDGRFDDSMSEQNVHQIVSRFRKALRERLEGTGRAA